MQKKLPDTCVKIPPALLWRVWHLAWPLILANASAPLLGLVDIALMGRQPDGEYLAAVAIGANLFGLVAWGFNVLTMATSGSTAWVLGRAGLAAAGIWLRRLSLWVLGLGLLIVMFSPLLIPLVLGFYNPAPSIGEKITQYLTIRVWSVPLVLLNLLLAGWFIGIQRTRTNLYATLAAQLVNILLSVLLVFGFSWRIEGVAWGSVAGDLCAFVIYSSTAFRLLKLNLYTANHRLIPSLLHYVWLGLPLVVRTFTLLFAFNYFARLGLDLGPNIVAANAVLLTFLLVISSGLDGFANAAQALVGKASGEADSPRVKQSILATGGWSLTMAVLLTLGFAVVHVPFIHALTDLPEVRQLAKQYAPWMIFMPLYTWWAYWLDGVYIGLQWVRSMRNVLLISVFGVYWPLSLLLPITHNHAIWALFASMMALRSLLMVALLWHRWQRL